MKINLINQIIKFSITGFICFGVDYGILYILTDFCDLYYLISSGISFSFSVIVNYILSIKWVFISNHVKKRNFYDFIIFVVLSVIGLIINQIVMWCGVDYFNFYYLVIKIFATAIVMVYNFITRKIFVEK